MKTCSNCVKDRDCSVPRDMIIVLNRALDVYSDVHHAEHDELKKFIGERCRYYSQRH